VDTADEALVLSLTEKAHVDLLYMAQVTGKAQDEIIRDLTGVIFRDPEQDEPVYLPADEYLSGNVRQKLAVARLAAASDPDYQVNVKALEQVQPKDLDASEIAVRLGATWIPPEYIQDFLMELLEPPLSTRLSVKVLFAPFTGEWNICIPISTFPVSYREMVLLVQPPPSSSARASCVMCFCLRIFLIC